MTQQQKRVVISAVNFSEGGPLTVLIECLASAAETLGPEWDIVALVHDQALIQQPRVRTIAFPASKRSWRTRLGLEWGGGFMALSRELNPDLWLSLHDITPRVQARRQAVYCHNPSPFYALSWREARLEPTFALFNLFYAQLYRMFIGRNRWVVVQQQWLRQAFERLYGHPNVVVAHPGVHAVATPVQPEPVAASRAVTPARLVLLYPALPRVFKNLEVLCEAVAQLPAAVAQRLVLRFTVDGSENRYAHELVQRHGGVPGLEFIGRQNRQQMAAQYAQCDVVLFPSKLETWGLPITEAKALGKPLLVADLPYAREAVGDYDAVTFLPTGDAQAWAAALQGLVDGHWQHAGHVAVEPAQPYAEGWPQLWKLLTEGL